jgi:hypothetical protein
MPISAASSPRVSFAAILAWEIGWFTLVFRGTLAYVPYGS